MTRLLVAAGLAFAVACGSAPISTQASSELQAEIEGIRAAADAGDLGGAQARVAEFRTRVEALRAEGAITPERADTILAALADVEANLVLIPTPTPPPRPDPTPPPRPADDEFREDLEEWIEDKVEKGKDKRKGEDDD